MSNTTFTPKILVKMVATIVVAFLVLTLGLISCLRLMHSGNKPAQEPMPTNNLPGVTN